MLLSAFSYKEANWELVGLKPLNPVNLVVGRNSTGKTRTIHAIQNVASFLQMKQIILGGRDFSAEMSFLDKNDAEWSMFYSFKVKDGVVEKESLSVCGRTLIKRTKSMSSYEGQAINPPAEKLIVQIRRDKNSFPDIEKLMVWAEGIVSVSCSDINPFTTIIPSKIFAPIPFYEIVDKLSETDKKNVLKRAKEVGYNLTSIITRDELYAKMKEANVLGRRYFYPLISEFSTYRGLESADPKNLPNAHKMADSVICLPMHHELTDNDIERVLEFFKK